MRAALNVTIGTNYSGHSADQVSTMTLTHLISLRCLLLYQSVPARMGHVDMRLVTHTLGESVDIPNRSSRTPKARGQNSQPIDPLHAVTTCF